MFWYWSLLALLVAVGIVTAIGLLTRYYIGKRMIAWADTVMLRVPVLNKIYGTIKQVDEAFKSGKKSSFKTVVLVEYPREGIYSVGFITSEQADEVERKPARNACCVFIPTTPIPTGGFLILVPEEKVIKLDMSVADGFKYIISLGALSQEYTPAEKSSSSSSRLVIENEDVEDEHENEEDLEMIESTTGIILRTRPLTETSLIVHWLTPDFGRIADRGQGRAPAEIAVPRQAGFVL